MPLRTASGAPLAPLPRVARSRRIILKALPRPPMGRVRLWVQVVLGARAQRTPRTSVGLGGWTAPGAGRVREPETHAPRSAGLHGNGGARDPPPRHAHFLPHPRRPGPSPREPDALSVSSSASSAAARVPGEAAGTQQGTGGRPPALAGPLSGAGRSWARTVTARGGDPPRRWVPGALLHAAGRRGGGCGTCPPAASPSSSSCCSCASSSGEDRRKKR